MKGNHSCLSSVLAIALGEEKEVAAKDCREADSRETKKIIIPICIDARKDMGEDDTVPG